MRALAMRLGYTPTVAVASTSPNAPALLSWAHGTEGTIRRLCPGLPPNRSYFISRYCDPYTDNISITFVDCYTIIIFNFVTYQL